MRTFLTSWATISISRTLLSGVDICLCDIASIWFLRRRNQVSTCATTGTPCLLSCHLIKCVFIWRMCWQDISSRTAPGVSKRHEMSGDKNSCVSKNNFLYWEARAFLLDGFLQMSQCCTIVVSIQCCPMVQNARKIPYASQIAVSTIPKDWKFWTAFSKCLYSDNSMKKERIYFITGELWERLSWQNLGYIVTMNANFYCTAPWHLKLTFRLNALACSNRK